MDYALCHAVAAMAANKTFLQDRRVARSLFCRHTATFLELRALFHLCGQRVWPLTD